MEEELHWYALKIFFNKLFEAETVFAGQGLESYFPVELVRLKGEDHLRAARRLATPDDFRQDNRYVKIGPAIFLRKPVVNSLIFVRTTASDILRVGEEFRGKGFLYTMVDKKVPYIIPDKEMAMFRLVTSSGDNGLKFFSDESITRYKQGDRVRVKEGPLKGTEGYIKRIGRDRRLLVAIEGFVAVATSFIPFQNLEKVSDHAD